MLSRAIPRVPVFAVAPSDPVFTAGCLRGCNTVSHPRESHAKPPAFRFLATQTRELVAEEAPHPFQLWAFAAPTPSSVLDPLPSELAYWPLLVSPTHFHFFRGSSALCQRAAGYGAPGSCPSPAVHLSRSVFPVGGLVRTSRGYGAKNAHELVDDLLCDLGQIAVPPWN